MITGHVHFGPGAETYTYNSSVGTFDGSVNMGNNDDILTIAKNFNPASKDTTSFQSITGVSLMTGYGADTLTINSGTTVTGNIITSGYHYVGSDSTDDPDIGDTIAIHGALTGDLWTGDGNDTITLSGSMT